MKVMVTGATVPFGIALVKRLLARPDVAHVLAVGAEPVAIALPPDPRLTYAALDLTRERGVHDLLYGPARRLGVDVVIHGALHRDARDGGRRVHALNVETTRHLLSACEDHPTVRAFVFRSSGLVYALSAAEPTLLDEDQPLDFDPASPQWVRDRVEADLAATLRIGRGRLSIAVLRCAEVLAAGTGSQLWDYLQSRVCLRPWGFDPMLDVLSLPDACDALVQAAARRSPGVFNITGADILPLSRVIGRSGRRDVPLPGPVLAPLYRLRAVTVGFEFRYDLNMRRFHFGGVLDGTRARLALGYQPRHPIVWPVPAPHADVAWRLLERRA